MKMTAFIPKAFWAGVMMPVCILLACKTKKPAAASEIDLNATPAAAKQESLITQLDSSMISLKKAGMVSLEAVVCQTWVLDDADKAHWNSIFWDSATDTRKFPEIALFPDNSATVNPRCGLRTGKWKLNKDTRELTLSLTGGEKKVYEVRQVAMKQVELGEQRADGMAVITCKAEGLIHKDIHEDPYHPSNLQWRFKPKASESRDQLRKRVREYVHFFALYFADNHNRQESDISFSGLPCCFVWYNGGIGMQGKHELDKRWIDCFYSENQAFTAYDMIADEIGRHELKWPEHPTSWIQQTGQVLGQLAGKF